MKNHPSKSRMPFAILGFLIIVAGVLVINRFMVKGISETEKQIHHFQSQSGIQQEQLETLSSELGVSREITEPNLGKVNPPAKGTARQQKVSDDVIYEPALDSVMLVQ